MRLVKVDKWDKWQAYILRRFLITGKSSLLYHSRVVQSVSSVWNLVRCGS